MTTKPKLIIVCGPTASSKSAYAMKMAKQLNGVIINADSMQIYTEIPIITASPSSSDKAQIPHYLYNFISVQEKFSVAHYLNHALSAIDDANVKGLMPIIVGGTGLYIDALINGLSSIPDIDDEIRQKARLEFDMLGIEKFYERLMAVDPTTIIKSGDRHRMIRAYEVFLQTKQPISYFHEKAQVSPITNYKVSIIMLKPERSFLYRCCDQRFINMINDGGLEEVKSLKSTGKSSKALGATELTAYLDGVMSLEDAIELAQMKTRQYAKRQLTWFNNRIKSKEVIEFQSFEALKL